MSADAQTDSVRVLIADDHRLFRDGIRALLAVTAGIVVVGEAADTDTAIALAQQMRPDVVLMDVQMPTVGGLRATAEITGVAPEVAVLMLTMVDDPDTVLSAVRAGARGYLLKDADAEDLVRGVRAAGQGEAIFGSGVAAGLLDHLGGRAVRTEPFADLTRSERSVLRLLARGQGNGEISRALSLSEKTVRNYVSNVFAKLGVEDRARAVVVARQAGLHHAERHA